MRSVAWRKSITSRAVQSFRAVCLFGFRRFIQPDRNSRLGGCRLMTNFIDAKSAEKSRENRPEALATQFIAGVNIPGSPIMSEVLEYAQTLYEPYLFNHAMRSWLFAAKIGELKGIDCDMEIVAVGTILHDIGLASGV